MVSLVLLELFGHFLVDLVLDFVGGVVGSFACVEALPWSFSSLLIRILQLLYLIPLFKISGIVLCVLHLKFTFIFIFVFICTLLTFS